MKVVYLANFSAGCAQDELAVQAAFEELGHTVWPVREAHAGQAADLIPRGPDLFLFNKHLDEPLLEWFRGVCSRAFWYWDLVDWPADPLLYRRSFNRRLWQRAALPHIEFGFLSDGDWVAADRSGKLHFLPQGADGLIAGRGKPQGSNVGFPNWDGSVLLTAAARNCGAGRRSFCDELERHWGGRVLRFERGVYREQLARLIATAKVVVCPDAPVTDRYCSNRIWNTCGFAGFVLHPACAFLEKCYSADEVKFYRSREHLDELINHWLGEGRAEERRAVGEAALERTRREHLYRHRVEKLIQTVQGKA